MSKIDRDKEKARHARRLAKQMQVTAELAQREDTLAVEELDVAEEQPTVESEAVLVKHYEEAMPMMSMRGPTSFDELEQLRLAQEQAEHVQEVTWDVQTLVGNILGHPDLSPSEKAGRIQDVAAGFEQRASGALKEAVMEKSVDALQAQALLAAYERNQPFLQNVVEKSVAVVKAVVDTATRRKLVDADFALVEEMGDEGILRKYPIHDKTHVRKSLAEAAEKDDEDARKALPLIKAAAKKFGIEMSKSAILIEKDAKGDWRWIGRPTNNFIDYQTDIISKSAHEKYAGWLDANPDMAPVFVTWHLPGTARANPVDFWMEQVGALIMSGILTEPEAAALFKMQKDVDLGMSFQGLGLRLDSDPRVITDYWMYEVSDLPLDKAANPFTALETMIKEVGMDKLQYLAGIMGSEEKAKAYLEKTGQMQKELQAAGITSKANEEAVVEEKPTQPTTPALDVQALIPLIAKAMRDELDIDGLEAFVAQAQEDHAKVETLEELVKTLNSSREDALAEALTPPVGRYAWSKANRPSQADSTKLSKDNKGKEDEEDEKLLKAMPGVSSDYWLSQLTNTAPVTQE